jgi:hypothetical protein
LTAPTTPTLPEPHDDLTARIIDLYHQGLPTRRIGPLLDIAPNTVSRRLKAAGIEVRPASSYPGMKGEANPRYKGCIHENCYRRRAFEHYGRRCQRCGATPKRLVVHHRNRDRSDGRVENLEPLCYSCHDREHAAERTEARRRNRATRQGEVQTAPRMRDAA